MVKGERLTAIRLGIVGCGTFTCGSHLPVIVSLSGIRVAALCDPDPAALSAAQNLVGSSVQIARDYRAVLDVPEVNAVLVATPTHRHVEIAAAALRAGKDVLCEKPLASRPEEVSELLDAWKASGRLLQVGYVYRYAPIFRRMWARIEQGEIGRPLMMWAHEFRAAFYTPWRYDAEISGGTLVEKCCHHFDLFQWMLGSPIDRVSGTGGQAVVRPGAEVETIIGTMVRVPDTKNLDHAWILTEHANGARAALGLSLFSPHGPYGKSDADLESLDVGVIGEEGKLVAYVRRNELRSWPRSGGKGRVERLAPKQGAQGWHAGGREQWQEFIACVRSRRQPVCDGVLGIQGLLPAFAAEQAIRESRSVAVAESARAAKVTWPDIL
ncbi:MAG TPA: Gfo/Idh/MocA family oxidoreductase [Candidatus Baltobacteraceae bacterium]|nr:Gfo/Idh/MocA family oxidoreductase [Candidatus Baltobacteraceae bacterium]